MNEKSTAELALRGAALRYHEYPAPGKLAVRVTTPMTTQRDLSLAYSPGVAEACMDIHENAADAFRYTGKGNRVAVISNGTAVLGLGDIGALASKPVMEGKIALFKKFADLDGFDIEVNEDDPQKLAEIVIALEPTFGAVNLEDIKAPQCFEVERICKERMTIPVFHDDQHGTAIVVAAGAINAMQIAGKEFGDIKVAAVGGGAAGIACLTLLMDLGVKRENIWMCDRKGLCHMGRDDLDATKQRFAQPPQDGTPQIDDVIDGADMFLGVSGPGVITAKTIRTMASDPVIMALANPTPEIMPEEAKAAREDAIICTGRSDYPNQINNVLCFPFIFRGALDVGATQINEPMKVACAHALAELARKTSSAEAAIAYQGERMVFGREYLIPKPFDPRLLATVASAVAQAAMDTGVAERPVDIEAYREKLEGNVFKTAMLMRPVFDAAQKSVRRAVFAEGEDTRVLRATQSMIEEGIEHPILIGRPDVIRTRIERDALPIRQGRDFDVIDPTDDPRYRDYWQTYQSLTERSGVSPALAQTVMRTNTTAIAAVAVRLGHADSMICGTAGDYSWHLQYAGQILGGLDDHSGGKLHPIGALSPIILEQGMIFIADSEVHIDPDPQHVAETCVAAARHIRRFGVEPKIALISHSVFGSLSTGTGAKMRAALAILDEKGVDFEYEGEMHADHALDPDLRQTVFCNSRLTGKANCLVFANVDAVSGARNLLKQLADGIEIGPILMGMGNRVQIVSPSVTPRGLLNIAALACAPVASYG